AAAYVDGLRARPKVAEDAVEAARAEALAPLEGRCHRPRAPLSQLLASRERSTYCMMPPWR
ncbi:hypothetical protein ACWDR1_34610, partial [Streptosporangium sandarakinum]